MNYMNDNCTAVPMPTENPRESIGALMADTNRALNESLVSLSNIWSCLTGEERPPVGQGDPKCMMDSAIMNANTARAILSAITAIGERLGI